MANTHLVGDDGKITFGSDTVLAVTSWSVDVTGDVADTTSMNNGGWKTSIPSMKSWTGSCETILTLDDTTGADITADDAVIGSTVAVVFFADAAVGNGTYSGNAIITGYSVKSSIGDKLTASVTLQGTGALTGV